MTRKYHKSRPQRLLRKVLSYNVEKAIKLASKGKHPFPLSSISDANTSPHPNLAWDYESLPVSRESALYATPFSCSSVKHLFGRMADGTMNDLNATTDSICSQLSTVSHVEERIRSNPDAFTIQCKRIIRVLVNNVPKPEVLANLNSERIALICTKMEKGVRKLDSYASILEEYLTADESTLGEEEMRSLEHLHGSLTSSLLDLGVSLTNLEKTREDVEREEKQRKMVEKASSDTAKHGSSQSLGAKTVRSVKEKEMDNPEIRNLFAQEGVFDSQTVFTPVASSEQRREVTWRLPELSDNSRVRASDSLATASTFSPNFTTIVPTTVQTIAEASESSGSLSQNQGLGSWRDVDHDPTSIVEILIVDEMKQVKEIIDSVPPEDIPDAELLNLEEKEVKNLQKILNQMMERLAKMEEKGNQSASYQRIYNSAMDAHKEAREWIIRVSRLIKGKELWYASSKSLGTPLKLEPFDGWKSDVNVFEFLKMFKIVTRNLSQKDAAQYLYNNYLSKDLQASCKHVRHNLEDMMSLLSKKFGDVSRILEEKKSQIKALPIPSRTNKSQERNYFKNIAEILDQIENLVVDNKDQYKELYKDVYSYSLTNELVKLLPDFIKKRYIEEYVKVSDSQYDGAELSGKKSFELLSKFVHQQYRSVEFLMDKLSVEKDDQVKRKVSTLSPKPKKAVMSARPDRWVRSVCFMHKELKKKIQECVIGECSVFLNATPQERRKKAVEFGLCLTCFMFKCYKKSSNGKCLYKDQIPVLVICQGCAVHDGRDCNVLMCSKHTSDTKEIRKALASFLAGFDDSTNIKMYTLGVYKMRSNSDGQAEEEFDSKVFDVSKGRVLDKKDVLNKIHPNMKEDSLYLFQQLSFNGKSATVFYDSGASMSAVEGAFAREVGFQVIDGREQFINVAGGSTFSTGFGIFGTTLGPAEDGTFFRINMLGMEKITTDFPVYDLSNFEKELRQYQKSSPISKEPCPKFVGGSVKIILGIKESYIQPRLEMILPSGLQVYRSQIKDVFNSNLIFAGPHADITLANSGQSDGMNNLKILFSSEYNSFRNSLYTDSFLLGEPVPYKTRNIIPLESGFNPVFASAIEETQIAQPECPLNKLSLAPGDLKQSFSFCRCCFAPGVEVSINEIKAPNKCEWISVSDETLVQSKFIANQVEFGGQLPNFRAELHAVKRKPRALEQEFKEIEDIGSRITYRCARCSSCEECKNSERTRETSIREEIEEDIINRSIDINLEEKVTYSRFPFKRDPERYLARLWNGETNNYKVALKIFDQQRRKSLETRKATVKFHSELVDKGFVVPFLSLPQCVQERVNDGKLKHYLYWRTVFNENSLSTPARIVVDPSMSGFNDTLAKGINCLNSLYMIGINWRSWIVGFTADISKMYNTIKLYESEYRYVLYLWSPTLDPQEVVETWVYVCVTYGLVSSGNITTAALRRIATMFKDQYPLAYVILLKFTYMDDISGGASEKADAVAILKQIEEVIPNAGFKLKVTCISGEPPPEKASADRIHTMFCGYRWATQKDLMMIGFSEVNFNPKLRGAKKPNEELVDSIEKVEKLVDSVQLTRRMCLSKVMELYDAIGVVEVIKAKLKLDMKEVTNFEFDEVLPENLQEVWKKNITLIHQAKSIKFPRSFVPVNAKEPESIELIVTCDAAQWMCGVAIYSRMLTKDGTYCVRLVTARSKSVHHTIPRNELEALVLASETLFCVLKALGSRCRRYWIASDSEIVLAWVTNDSKPLKQFCFNRVQHIRRLIDIKRLFHVPGLQNPSDMLTRGVDVTPEELQEGSEWQSGAEWMSREEDFWPLRSFEKLRNKMDPTQVSDMEKEILDLPSIHKVGDTMVWNFSDSCCKIPLAPVGCHCEFSEKCCFCLERDFSYACEAVFEQSVCADSGPTMTTIISQVYAYTSQCFTLEEIKGQFPISLQYQKDLETNNLSRESFYKITQSQKANENTGMLIEPVFKGFKLSFAVIALVMRFVTRVKHRVHCRTSSFHNKCQLCVLQAKPGKIPDCLINSTVYQPLGLGGVVFTSDYDYFLAWKYICKQTSMEVLKSTSLSQREAYELGEDGILYAVGRLPKPVTLSGSNPLSRDVQFVKPVALVSSKFVYSLAMHLHWLYGHPGVETLVHLVLQAFHVENIRKLCKYIRKTCNRCRFLMKVSIRTEAGSQSQLACVIAPVFFSCQMDVASGLTAFGVNSRVSKPAYFLILVCMVTSAVSITTLEDLSTGSVVAALERHSSRYGVPKILLPDLQSSFAKLEDLRVNFKGLQGCLFTEQQIILDFCTPGNHREHGKVEARVKIVKELLEKTGENGIKHSFLQWETVALRLSTFMNSLPIARGEDSRNPKDMEVFGVICPNHFILGANPKRILDGTSTLVGSKCKMLENLEETRTFLEDALLSHLHRFIPSSLGHKSDKVPEVGDLVIFTMKDNMRSRNKIWKFGRVIQNYVDGRGGKLRICYKNANEAVVREIERHLNQVCLIQSLDEVDFNTEQHRLAMEIQQKVQ